MYVLYILYIFTVPLPSTAVQLSTFYYSMYCGAHIFDNAFSMTSPRQLEVSDWMDRLVSLTSLNIHRVNSSLLNEEFALLFASNSHRNFFCCLFWLCCTTARERTAEHSLTLFEGDDDRIAARHKHNPSHDIEHTLTHHVHTDIFIHSIAGEYAATSIRTSQDGRRICVRATIGFWLLCHCLQGRQS